jgi:endogenous inhibitor of DNA gyrase (YacG/DUF329 family)
MAKRGVATLVCLEKWSIQKIPWQLNMFSKKCIVCGKLSYRKKLSEAKRKNWKFCSRSCHTRYCNYLRRNPAKKKYCFYCKKSFKARTKRELKYRFCSQKCSVLFLNQTEEQRKRVSLRSSGQNSNFWKGGITSTNVLIRNSVKYSRWRAEVFEIDNYTCWICNQWGGILRAHHLKRFSGYPELRFEISNGLTLCDFCHRTYTTNFGRVGGKNGYGDIFKGATNAVGC